jgi:hypothetical protein
LLDNGIHLNRVPEDNDVDDETQSAELILLSLSIMLPQFTSFAMENDPRQAVSMLAAIELNQHSSAFRLIIDRRQNMDRLVDAARERGVSYAFFLHCRWSLESSD